MLRTENLKMEERISTAMYFITSFFEDNEPLKWKLRSLATDMLSNSIKDKSVIYNEILSMFFIAKNASLVSDINYEILIKELSKLENNAEMSLNTLLTLSPPQPAIKDKPIISVKKNTRQDTILDIIKRKKEVMVRDISSLVTGYSDKTIQRELLAMVKAGILKKFGEKRWSRYSLS